jgi:hypothetical protein
VRVRDDGPGIDPAEADRLFTLYFRSEATASAPGSGIGLFVCRELIGAMGGQMWVTGDPGAGAEFGFTLPVYGELQAEVPAIPPAPVAVRPTPAIPESIAASVASEDSEDGQAPPDDESTWTPDSWLDGPAPAQNASPA